LRTIWQEDKIMMTRKAVLILTVASMFVAAPPSHSEARSEPSTQTRAVQALPLRPVGSPQGDFSILAPAGWTIQQPPQSLFTVLLKPQSNSSESVYVIVITVSDLRYLTTLQRCNQQFARNPLFAPDAISGCVVPAVRAQMEDSNHRWSSADALRLTLQLFASAGSPFQLTNTNQGADGVLRYRALIRQGSQQVASGGTVAMAYFSNPLFSTATASGVTSLALISGCNAPLTQEESFGKTCGAILHSFQMNPQAMNRITAELMQSYQQEAQTLIQMGQTAVKGFANRSAMIANWGAQMQQMQKDAYDAIQAARYHDGQNWIATLGNEVNMQNPETGNVYSLPAGYGSYCLDASGQTALMGPDLKPGESIGHSSPQCQTVLHSW
jgi:hypothetical protein